MSKDEHGVQVSYPARCKPEETIRITATLPSRAKDLPAGRFSDFQARNDGKLRILNLKSGISISRTIWVNGNEGALAEAQRLGREIEEFFDIPFDSAYPRKR